VLGTRIEDVAPVALPRDAGLTRLVGAMFRSMTRQPEQAGRYAGDVAHMVRLALLARGRLRRASMRSAPRCAQDFSTRHARLLPATCTVLA
jgi:hypothetical protein